LRSPIKLPFRPPTINQSCRAPLSRSQISSIFNSQMSKFLNIIEQADPNRFKHCFRKKKTV
jgi:hypothetical protein